MQPSQTSCHNIMDITYRSPPPTPNSSAQTIDNTRPYLLQLAKEVYLSNPEKHQWR